MCVFVCVCMCVCVCVCVYVCVCVREREKGREREREREREKTNFTNVKDIPSSSTLKMDVWRANWKKKKKERRKQYVLFILVIIVGPQLFLKDSFELTFDFSNVSFKENLEYICFKTTIYRHAIESVRQLKSVHISPIYTQ